jgi:topoisomerase-4 subunit A
MSRGRGVILQRYRQGGLADITVFDAETGLSWDVGNGRTRRETMAEWVAPRGTSGKAPPHGFPRSGRFD